ncbi:lysophospholipid acyltransferase family protein [Rubrolithibacter danxiaensis]|uniref:lysophospholipid acyltransferase family protein n=1 Tax=Rubrolithibacter danxiaensis TaxID=3390805 RepID=UPI003BF7EA94
MDKPRSNKIIHRFFSWYINLIIKKDFSGFNLNSLQTDPEKAILLLSNHFSWWDGFLVFQLNRLLFKRKFYVMVTEENYRKVWFLKYLGAFSIKRNSKSSISSLEYAGQLLNDPANLVLFFPQGKLYSNHVTEVDFQKGLINIINASNKNFQYVFLSMFVDYYQCRKPFITCYLKTWAAEEYTSLQLIKSAFNKHYEKSRSEHNRAIV